MGNDISPTEAARLARLYAQKMGFEQKIVNQIIAKESFQEWADTADFQSVLRNFRTLEEEKLKAQKVKAADKKEGVDEEEAEMIIDETASSEELANEFERNNPELKTKTLLILRSLLKESDNPETVLEKVRSVYKDPSLAHDALEFLQATSKGSLQKAVTEALSLFRAQFEREILAGKNIYHESRSFAEEGLGHPDALREMYRDITGNIRQPTELFDELFQHYKYEKMKPMIEFLLSAYGADLRSKGPSIERAELVKLVDDARLLQAFLGTYQFFKERMSLIDHQFSIYETTKPQLLNFELLARAYLDALKERYPSPIKFRDLGKQLSIYHHLAAEIVIFTQMRDAVRQVSPRLYRDERHRKSMLQSWIDLLENLEEEYEEEE
ncbi:MAG: HrpJ domain-containing protein [Chlamydiota bacterium]